MKFTSADGRKNDGRSYEELVEKVFIGLQKLHGVDFQNIKIARNIKLDAITKRADGKPIQREIDLYWEFKAGGINYCAVVQAKDLKRKVNLGAIDTFKNVLIDLPGQPKGIFVTTVGFQAGALEYANAHGIDIYVLEKATPELFGGSIPQIAGSASPFIMRWSNERICTDKQLEENDSLACTNILSNPPENTPVIDLDGKEIGTLDQIYQKAKEEWRTSKAPTVGVETALCFLNACPIFLQLSDCRRVRIAAVKIDVETVQLCPTIQINTSFTHVLQLVVGAEKYTVDSNFVVRKLGEPLTANIFRQECSKPKSIEELFEESKALNQSLEQTNVE